MASYIKQGILKQAKNKKGAKYKKKYSITQTVKSSNGTQTTKYAYTKKVYVNGKPRYYYA
jgi:hypothetical protein